MRALVLDSQLTFRDSCPDPAPVAGESLVRVRMAGICGTDLEIARGYMSYRGVLGHEFVGEVVDTRIAALAGRRVVGQINAGCGRCAWCARGLQRHCPNRTVLGIVGRDGAFAEYLRLPDENLVPVPNSISDEMAVFVEPIAAIYEIFEQTRIAREGSIAILGDGRLGTLASMVLRAEGYTPIVAGHHREKLARIAALGIKALHESELRPGFDVVIDCSGAAAGLGRALALVCPRGTIVLKSTAATGANINLAPAVINEVTILGSRCGRFEPAIDALASGRLDPSPLISKVLPLEQGAMGFEEAGHPANFKVLLKP